jgi:hypothetical protein
MFFQLTEGQNRNLGEGASPASAERDAEQAMEGANE